MPRTGASARGATCPVYLMPPEDFLPFMVPFKGGAGPLCGGACTDSFQWSVDSDPYAFRMPECLNYSDDARPFNIDDARPFNL